MGSLKIGRGTEEGVQVGPLINDEQRSKVASWSRTRSAKGRAGRRRRRAAPTAPATSTRRRCCADVPDDARLLKEEIFGPVAPVKRFTDEDEALRMGNDTEYGLVAYLYTRDLGRAMRVMERLEYGMIGLNQGMVSNPAAPFGGIKHSGVGREGGYEGIEEYLETKYCAVSY